MRILRNPDANTESTSSDDSQVTAESQPTTQQQEESSTSTDVKEPKTPDDVVETVVKATEESSTKETQPEETVEKSTEEKVDNKTEDVVDESEKEKAKDELPPFHEHPRWQEKLAENKELQTTIEKLKPSAERAEAIDRFCATNSITTEQFQQALEVAALLNADPAKALERLTPVYEALQQYNGSKLPDDLQADIDAGTITIGRAKEIARYRAEVKVNEKRGQHSAQQAQQQEQSAVMNAVVAWDTAKRKSDPNFKPKSEANAVNGLWEFVSDRFNVLVTTKFANGVKPTPQDVIQIAEQAYNDVKKSFGTFSQPKKAMKSLTSSGSSTHATPAPKNADDVINAIANGVKLEL